MILPKIILTNKQFAFLTVSALVLVAILSGWFLVLSFFQSTSEQITPKASATSAPILNLTAKEKAGDVLAEKSAILALARSAKPLSVSDKQRISVIMLFKSKIYDFSDKERALIFKALNRK